MEKRFTEKLEELRSKYLLKDPEVRLAIEVLKRKGVSLQDGWLDVDETEVQRLRSALVEIKQLLNEDRENDGAFQSWNHMQAWKVATQALSPATKPTDAAKVEWFECPHCRCEIIIKSKTELLKGE